jgi:hypothetical protein
MTTMYPAEVTCAACGTVTEFMEIGSTSVFGSPDLDLRPAPLARFNLSHQVQCCPECGYCAEDISEPLTAAAARELLSSEQYQAQLQNPSLPKLTNQFICLALLQEQEGDWEAAAWAYLQAAWACDDEENDTGACQCRLRAAQHFQQVLAAQESDPSQRGTWGAVLTDVLRRSRQFDSALAMSQQRLAETTDATIQAVLRYEQALIGRQDAGCHGLQDAIADAQPDPA